MAQHIKVNLENVAPKLYKKLKQLEKMNIFHSTFSELPEFKKVSVLGLDIMKLSRGYSIFKYPVTIKNGSNYIVHKDWIDLKSIADIEVHFNKNFKLKNSFIVA